MTELNDSVAAETRTNPWVSHIEHNQDGRTIHFTAAGSAMLRRFLDERESAFHEQFGYPMGPRDPLLWDPDAPVPMPLSEERFVELLAEQAVSALGGEAQRSDPFASAVTRTFLMALTGLGAPHEWVPAADVTNL